MNNGANLRRLALLITSDRYLSVAKGVIARARHEGIELSCFLTGEGVRVLRDPSFLDDVLSGEMDVCACEHSWELLQMGEPLVNVCYGSQYQNSAFVAAADKVLVI